MIRIESSVLIFAICAYLAVWIPHVRSGGMMVSSCIENSTRAEPGSNCTNFQVCGDNNTYFTSPCPKSLLFNEDMGWCDFPSNVNSTTCTNGSSAYAAAGAGAYCIMGSVRPTPGTNCTEYETCLDGSYGFSRACPLGTLWNTDSGSCDYEENVGNLTTCTTVNNTDPGCNVGQGYAVISDKCRTYQVCLPDYKLSPPLQCPTDMGFADDEGFCLSKKLVSNKDCTVRSTYECTEGTYNATSYCTGYIACISPGVWNLVEQDCPNGTLFAYNATQCEYTASVDKSTCLLI